MLRSQEGQAWLQIVLKILKVFAKNKDVFSMADRQDDILTQMGDGYSSFVAGIKSSQPMLKGVVRT